MRTPYFLCIVALAHCATEYNIQFNNRADDTCSGGGGGGAGIYDTSCKVVIVGAGPGGLYSAWRLQTSDKYEEGDVCLFERTGRIGGRVHTVREAFPEHPDWTFDVGAYRFHTGLHPFVTELHHEFNVPFRCYLNPLGDNSDCAALRRGAYLRGEWYNATQLDNSDNLPYKFAADEIWGPAATGRDRSSHPRPYDFLFGNPGLPELVDRMGRLSDPETAWETVDEISALVQVSTFNGIPYSQLSLADYAALNGVSDEALQFFLEADWDTGETALTRQSIAHLATEYARYFALFATRPSPTFMNIPVTEDNLPAGFDSILHKLLSSFEAAGGRTFFHYKVSNVVPEGTGARVYTRNAAYKAESVILNMPLWDVNAFGQNSEFWRQSSEEFKESVANLQMYPLWKYYLVYDEAWWYTKLDWSHGRVRTTAWTTQMRFHDGITICDNVATKTGCKGAVLASYQTDSGWYDSLRWADSNTEEEHLDPWEDNLMVFRRGQSDPQLTYLIDTIHDRVMRSLKGAFEDAGVSAGDIETLANTKPQLAIGGNWGGTFGSGVHVRKSSSTVNNKNNDQPIPGVRIYMANEAYGIPSGWSESAYVSAERVMGMRFGLDMPNIGNGIPVGYWETIQKYN